MTTLSATLQALDERPAGAWSRIVGLFTDIDDTLTTDGLVTPDALQALADLHDAGVPVIAVTGRPVGWSVPFALAWPVRAIVAENGAVALVRQDPSTPSDEFEENGPLRLPEKREQLSKIYQQDAATRTRNFAHLQRAAARVLREVPGSALAQDSQGRETDIALDHSEFSRLDEAQIAQAVAVMQAEGLHAWHGDLDATVAALATGPCATSASYAAALMGVPCAKSEPLVTVNHATTADFRTDLIDMRPFQMTRYTNQYIAAAKCAHRSFGQPIDARAVRQV